MKQLRLIALILCLISANVAFGQSKYFAFPLKGTPQKDFYFVNYVDHDTAKGKLKDFSCGAETYDGHQGTDIVLRDFKKMDSGVTVYAAANGRVVYVADSFYDRNKSSNVALGYGNYIVIKHSNGLFSYYAHLRKHSALVKLADSVSEGQALGLVGSSGNATDPHLHFEVWNTASKLLDPFLGTCSGTQSLWKTQYAYDTSYGIIDYGLVPFAPWLDTLRERVPEPAYFAKPDTSIAFWIHEYGIRKGDTSMVQWYTPANVLWYTFKYGHTDPSRYYYWWSYINMPAQAGTWQVKYSINNKVKATKSFLVKSSSSIDPVGTLVPGNTSASYNASNNTINFKTEITVQSPAAIKGMLYDYMGRSMPLKGTLSGDHYIIPLQQLNLMNGSYLITMELSGKPVSAKVVIIR